MSKYFEFGGLPGACFIRDQSLRKQRINEYLNTILDRDLRQVKKILVSTEDLRATLLSLAQQQGEPLDYTRLKQETKLSFPTLKKIIYCMEAVFLIRTLNIEGSTKGKTVFFEDMGEWNQVRETKSNLLQNLTHFADTQIRTQFSYLAGDATHTFQYHTRGGAIIPLAFKNRMVF